MADMAEKLAVATFLIAAFQAESEFSFIAGQCSFMSLFVSFVLTNARIK